MTLNGDEMYRTSLLATANHTGLIQCECLLLFAFYFNKKKQLKILVVMGSRSQKFNLMTPMLFAQEKNKHHWHQINFKLWRLCWKSKI